MHVIVMGCGRVGIAVASKLSSEGHFVSIIDKSAQAFQDLPRQFQGQKVVGVGFDLDTLREAGIEAADAFISVSSGDNSNIISARVAREKFNVKKVVARIYDPKRAEIYSRLGIPTIASVSWSTQQIIALLNSESSNAIWTDANNAIQVSSFLTPTEWITKTVNEIENEFPIRLISISRNSDSVLAVPNFILQQSDLIVFAYQSSAKNKLETRLKEVGRSL